MQARSRLLHSLPFACTAYTASLLLCTVSLNEPQQPLLYGYVPECVHIRTCFVIRGLEYTFQLAPLQASSSLSDER